MSSATIWSGGRAQIVETRLYFAHHMGWQAACTFVPGRANTSLQEQLEGLAQTFGETAEFEELQQVRSLREVVLTLHARQIALPGFPADPAAEAFPKWVKSLERDEDLLLDDSVVVHQSPPEWMSLGKLLERAPVAGIFAVHLISGSPLADAVTWVLGYGGSLLFIRLITGGEALVGDMFDHARKRTLPDYAPQRSTTHFVTASSEVKVTASGTMTAGTAPVSVEGVAGQGQLPPATGEELSE